MIVDLFKKLIEFHLVQNVLTRLQREDLGRLRLTCKAMQQLLDAREDVWIPYLPPCECPRQCDGRCACPYGTLLDRAMHFSRFTRSISDMSGGYIHSTKSYWASSSLPNSPFKTAISPQANQRAVDRLRMRSERSSILSHLRSNADLPRGRYVLMARISDAGPDKKCFHFETAVSLEMHVRRDCASRYEAMMSPWGP